MRTSCPPSVSDRIYACWLGKAIGGTLGTPHEGRPGPLSLDYYSPVPCQALPNDDLDLQIVWLAHLRRTGERSVTPELLAEAWQQHVLFPFDEYGVARRNRARGLRGPAQGATDNFFGECMGAAIRSEVWACLAPGDPARAAGFAWADATVDHCGDGVWAEVWHAALQSAAFAETDPSRLIDIGLSFLPADSRLKKALLDTLGWWRQAPDWRLVRTRIVEKYATGNFTDVVCNLCFELLGWFDGRGDFGRSICTAVNCGFDTDCTGATLGALLGIIDPSSIPPRWREPIGEDVVLSREIVGLTPPRTLAELTDWTLDVSAQLSACRPSLGAVLPCQPLTLDQAALPILAEQIGQCDPGLLTPAPLPALPRGKRRLLPGHWTRWSAVDFPEPIQLLRLPFSIGAPQPVKVLCHYTPKAAVWLDGVPLFSVEQNALRADPMAAPSFHRAGHAAKVSAPLESGRHELTLALRAPPAGTSADLVFGLGDPSNNLWLTGCW